LKEIDRYWRRGGSRNSGHLISKIRRLALPSRVRVSSERSEGQHHQKAIEGLLASCSEREEGRNRGKPQREWAGAK